MRILVVEDDELIGTAIARALHDAAYVADWVVDAPSAMGALLGREHDAVPFNLNEMLARLRAATRKLGHHPDATLSSGKLSLDPRTLVAVYNNVECRLSGREFAVLRALLSRP